MGGKTRTAEEVQAATILHLEAAITAARSVINEIDTVLGELTDKSFSGGQTTNPTVIGHLRASYYHVHDPAKVYPEGADPVTVTSSSGDPWEHGTPVEVIPAGAITTKFDIHWVLISAISAVDDYELKLWAGTDSGGDSDDEELATISFVRNDNFSQEGDMPIQIRPQPAGTRISASLACGDGDGATCNIKLYYHAYPDIE